MIRSFRNALSDSLMKLADADRDFVVFNADSARVLNLDVFKKTHPERIFCYGISEADMLSAAAGLSTTGLTPVVVGFSVFVTEKPFEQIRQSVCYPNLNVKIIATHAGLCVGQDGATHQNLEDLTIMRSLPNMSVLVAADAAQTEGAIRAMMAHHGPCYLRLGRDTSEDIYSETPEVEIGGSDLMADGGDVAIIACGLMVDQSLKAAKLLEAEGIKASVLNLYSIKPLDEPAIVALAKRTGALVTVEDHTVLGGLGGAVCEVLARSQPTPVEFVGIHDVFGESGTQEELFEKYGLTPDSIASAARRAVSRKKTRS
jgi:transketolase